MKQRGLGSFLCILGICLAFIAVIVIFFFFFTGKVNFSPSEEPVTHLACIDNFCSVVEGVGVNECSPEGSFCGCIDTDLDEDHPTGMNFFMQGTARNATLSKTDSCLPGGKLAEHVCTIHNEITKFEVTCESLGSYTCVEGKCFPDYLELEDCRDTDGGLNYQVEGKASNGKVRLADYCTGEGMLVETYCPSAGEEILLGLFDCKNLGNYVCEYGACVTKV
ncbi:MAG: hypothetical protein KKD18_02450 [Nanoarchaeota archaeon]|nr:hypothetical protein [Nanoarchaeota archaeon]MBU0977251.1 hypothetical protein [Nanoarchaeota archaeon]